LDLHRATHRIAESPRQALCDLGTWDVLQGQGRGREIVEDQLQEVLQVSDAVFQLRTGCAVPSARLGREMVDLLEEVAEYVPNVVDDLRTNDDHPAVIVWLRDPAGLALCNHRHVDAPQ